MDRITSYLDIKKTDRLLNWCKNNLEIDNPEYIKKKKDETMAWKHTKKITTI